MTSYVQSKTATNTTKNKQKKEMPAFYMIACIFIAVVAGSSIFLSQYNPVPMGPQPQISLDEKMAYLDAGKPLPKQSASAEIPRWMMSIILCFLVLQVLPLLLASYKARAAEFTPRDLREIEFLTETPLFFGLLGSLLGICMTQFISGSLAAPLAYLTTISGILLYLFGRFTISVSLPSSTELA